MIPQIIQDVLGGYITLFEKKHKEYKGDTADIFRNFNQGAKLSGQTPAEVLLGYANKQIVSLYDAPKYNPERMNDIAFVEEKARDIAIYMTILIAMTKMQNRPEQKLNNTLRQEIFKDHSAPEA